MGVTQVYLGPFSCVCVFPIKFSTCVMYKKKTQILTENVSKTFLTFSNIGTKPNFDLMSSR